MKLYRRSGEPPPAARTSKPALTILDGYLCGRHFLGTSSFLSRLDPSAAAISVGRHASCHSCVVPSSSTSGVLLLSARSPQCALQPMLSPSVLYRLLRREVKKQRAVSNAKLRARRHLTTARIVRLFFRPRCPVCRRKVEETYIQM